MHIRTRRVIEKRGLWLANKYKVGMNGFTLKSCCSPSSYFFPRALCFPFLSDFSWENKKNKQGFSITIFWKEMKTNVNVWQNESQQDRIKRCRRYIKTYLSYFVYTSRRESSFLGVHMTKSKESTMMFTITMTVMWWTDSSQLHNFLNSFFLISLCPFL